MAGKVRRRTFYHNATSAPTTDMGGGGGYGSNNWRTSTKDRHYKPEVLRQPYRGRTEKRALGNQKVGDPVKTPQTYNYSVAPFMGRSKKGTLATRGKTKTGAADARSPVSRLNSGIAAVSNASSGKSASTGGTYATWKPAHSSSKQKTTNAMSGGLSALTGGSKSKQQKMKNLTFDINDIAKQIKNHKKKRKGGGGGGGGAW